MNIDIDVDIRSENSFNQAVMFAGIVNYADNTLLTKNAHTTLNTLSSSDIEGKVIVAAIYAGVNDFSRNIGVLLLVDGVVNFYLFPGELIHEFGLPFAPVDVLPLEFGVVLAEVKMFGEVVLPFEKLNGYVIVGCKKLIAWKTQVGNIPQQSQYLQQCKDQKDPKTLQKSDEIAHKSKDSKFGAC